MCVDLERSPLAWTTIDQLLITCRKTFIVRCLFGYENEFICFACIGWSDGIHWAFARCFLRMNRLNRTADRNGWRRWWRWTTRIRRQKIRFVLRNRIDLAMDRTRDRRILAERDDDERRSSEILRLTISCAWDKIPSRSGDELMIFMLLVCVRPDEIGIGWSKSGHRAECLGETFDQNYFSLKIDE